MPNHKRNTTKEIASLILERELIVRENKVLARLLNAPTARKRIATGALLALCSALSAALASAYGRS